MNFTKALDLITKTDKQIKELGEARDKLQLSLAALAELSSGLSDSNFLLLCTCPK